jgi:rod shape determining protein RodA
MRGASTVYKDDRSQYDLPMIIMYFVLATIGILTIYSSTYSDTSSWFNLKQEHSKQLLFFGISIFIGVVILFTQTSLFYYLAYGLFAAVILLTAGTFIFGSSINGAQAWYKIGSIQLQPAEFAKLGAALGLARYLGTYGVQLNSLKSYAIAFVFLIVPMGIVLAQNDTGSALVFFSLFLVLYRFGLPGWILGFGASLVVLFSILMLLSKHETIFSLEPRWFIIGLLFVVFSIVGYFVYQRAKKSLKYVIFLLVFYIGFVLMAQFAFDQLKGYQKRRIQLIYGLIEDNRGTGYNLNQSKIAIGSGLLTGKGFLEGTQSKQNYVPEPSTDFIFCTLAEESGFLGSMLFVALYVFFMYRLVVMAERQNTKFARAYGYGVFSIFLFHFFINVGMTMGMVPTIGIPLPFISYGGSSLLAFTILLFVFIKLDANRGNEVSIDL